MINPYDLCPCDSNLKSKFCCLQGKEWNKKPKLLINSSKTDYSHSKCFAKQTNNCTTRISKEHFISENILNNLSTSNSVMITGLHWQEPTGNKSVSKASLVANILCGNHNTMLSPFDHEMGRLHRIINQYDQEFQEVTYTHSFKLLCGEDLERWMLKTTCGFISSKQVYSGNKSVDCKIPDHCVDILFNNMQFPEEWGMYVDASDDKTLTHHNYIKVSFLLTDQILRGAKFVINSVTFYLLLSKPNSIKPGLIYRPRGIEMKKGEIKKRIEISWQNKKYDRGLFLTHLRNVIKSPAEWQEWVIDKNK